MPYMSDGKRDYKKQQKYDGKPSVIADRAQRNAARAKLKKEGVDVRGKDVAHLQPISRGGNNNISNLAVQTKTKNRSFNRKKDGSIK